MRMANGAGEDFIQPVLIPVRAVVEDIGHTGIFRRDGVCCAVADVPGAGSRLNTQVFDGPKDRIRRRFSFGDVIAAYDRAEEMIPTRFAHGADLVFHEFPVSIRQYTEHESE